MSDSSFSGEANGAAAGQADGATQNPMLSALLGAIGSGGTFDPASMLMSQFGGQAAGDPRMAALSWLMSQRRPGPEIEGETEAQEEAKAEAEQARAAIRAERARRIRELRALVKRTWAELQVLRERNDALAAALGACHLCFGTDPMCPQCAGQGGPGSSAPEPMAYRDYVVPAIRRVRAEMERRAHAAGCGPQGVGALSRALAPRGARDDDYPERPAARPGVSEEGRARV